MRLLYQGQSIMLVSNAFASTLFSLFEEDDGYLCGASCPVCGTVCKETCCFLKGEILEFKSPWKPIQCMLNKLTFSTGVTPCALDLPGGILYCILLD